MTKFIAVLAWLNFYALTWAILLNERLRESAVQATILCILFLILAIVSSSIQPKKEEATK